MLFLQEINKLNQIKKHYDDLAIFTRTFCGVIENKINKFKKKNGIKFKKIK